MMKIGISTVGAPITEEMFRSYARAGIDCMEISFHRPMIDELDLNLMRTWANQYNVELRSLHLPFGGTLDISLEDEEKRLEVVAYQKSLMKRGAEVGIPFYIIHPSGEPIAEERRTIRMAQAKKSLKTLADCAGELGVTLAVEDLPRTCLGRNSGEMNELMTADDRLRICFDTNHMLKESLPDFVRGCGSKIVSTHVSDYDFLDEKHWLPGEGQINWTQLLEVLAEVGYDDAWVYEVDFKKPMFLYREHLLTPEDFKRNADELFHQKPITVWGKHYCPRDLQEAPCTTQAHSVTLIWDKPLDYAHITGYRVYMDGQVVGERPAKKTHITVDNLKADTEYSFKVVSLNDNGELVGPRDLRIRTSPESPVIDVTAAPYLADPKGEILSTEAVQRAINDCPESGTVLIPEGAVILSGAISLKSNMIFRVDGMLKGSLNPADYTVHDFDGYVGITRPDGLVYSRYEGWEMYCYRSLVNAGWVDPEDRLTPKCENIRICGNGTIHGGGMELCEAEKAVYGDREKYPEYVGDNRGGRRVRGRLLGLNQCKNVDLTGVTVENPCCWTIHMLYCDTVTTHGISIISQGVENGDGWDPDSSRNMMIFDTFFDTGDDCIAIKSGKNPDGNKVNIPTENVRIFDLKMMGGHGMSIGSEQSGGVDGVYLRDCVVKNTFYGLQLKAHNDRGGYITNVHAVDCELDRFTAKRVTYNADGQAAPTLPYFHHITVENSVLTGDKLIVELTGFARDGEIADPYYYTQDVLVKNVAVSGSFDSTRSIYLHTCRDITFDHLAFEDGAVPVIESDETVTNLVIR